MENAPINTHVSTWSAIDECWKHRQYYYKTIGIALVIASVSYIITPTEYIAQQKIADESIETDLLLGLDGTTYSYNRFISKNVEDPIKSPEVYSLYLSSRDFCKELSRIAINDSTNYYLHLSKDTKLAWYEWIWGLFNNEDEEEKIIGFIQDRIKFSFSQKYNTVVIQVKDQKAEIASLIADSTTNHLQQAITRHRLHKKEEALTAAIKNKKAAEHDFHNAVARYTNYTEANHHAVSERTKSKIIKLREIVQLMASTYKEKSIAEARARALLYQTVPSFTTIINSTAPHHTSEPNFIVITFVYSFLAFVFTSWYILYLRSYRKKL